MTSPPEPFVFLRRVFPSANMVVIAGERPVLIDSGFGGDIQETEYLIRQSGVDPQDISLIANTHYHCDHAGGNSLLQRRYDIPVAAHRWEARMVNDRDREACAADWLAQPIEPYRVARPLSEGDRIEAGGVLLDVLETPGHTLGHLSFYAPEQRVLIGGDLVHADDVAWINIFREGVASVLRALESIERLSELKVEWACSGHGPPTEDFRSAAEAASVRYRKWLSDPQKAAWHACKRILTYALMIEDGMREGRLRPYLLAAPWFRDYSVNVFQTAPEDFIAPLLEEVIRSRAAEWIDEKLVPRSPYNPPRLGWPAGPARPADWPEQTR